MLDLTRLSEAVRHEGGITRRLWLAYGAALAALPVLGTRVAGGAEREPKFAADPFSLGVASGDPASDSAVLWTRLAPKPLEEAGGMKKENVEIRWEVADDEAFKKVVRNGTVAAAPDLAHSVHVEVAGLEPDRWYFYRFHAGAATSPVGRTRTAPAPSSTPDRLKFAVASCQNYEQGLYTAYRHMAQDDPDFVVFLGDYIYEGRPAEKRIRREHFGNSKTVLLTLEDYRTRHSQYRSDRLLQTMHARCPWVVTWDDHEVENNYAGGRQGGGADAKKAVDPVALLKKRANAYQAYYEMMPLRAESVPKGPDMRLYRTVRFGRLAQFVVLDTRQYRTPQPNGDVRSDLNAAALNPANTLLGKPQLAYLKEMLDPPSGKPGPAWNVMAQQVMMAMVDRAAGPTKRYSMDQWPGAAGERMELLGWVARRKPDNVVVLSGDIHSNWVNDLRVDDRRPETPVVAAEFVGTSISSKGNGPKVPAGLAALLSENPCVKFHNDQRGYLRCTVTPKEWRSDFRIIEDVEKPGGGAVTAASFVVEAGKPGAVKA